MKKSTQWLLGVVLVSCLYLPSYAQNPSSFFKFFVTITDPAYEPTVSYGQDEVTVSFTQSGLNDITNEYVFKRFHRAYPNTTNTTLEDVFIVEASSSQCMYDLKTYSSTVFADASLANFQTSLITITDPAYVPTTSVINNQTMISFTQGALNTIAEDYIVDRFEPAFPQSSSSSQQNVYVVTVQNQAFFTALNNYNATVFTGTTSYAPKRFSIYITDPSYAAYASTNVNGQTVYTSSNTGVQAILNKYVVTQFYQAYPSSRLEHLRQIYNVEASSAQLMQDLINYDSYIFPSGKIENGNIKPVYTPIDFGKAFGSLDTTQRYLDLINARDAWGYFAEQNPPLPIGNSNVLIGVCDWYFDDKHPDLKNNIAKIFGVNDPSYIYNGFHAHGVGVAGTAAGSTDNGTTQNPVGQASIGFNCKLALYAHDAKGTNYEGHALEMSDSGVQIINMSFTAKQYPEAARHSGADLTKNQFYAVTSLNEDVYNEIYENGGSTVCAAGNGGDTAVDGAGNSYGNNSYLFPASFDHNISVTSIGSDWDSYHPSTGPVSIKDHHLISYQGGNHLNNSHNHNERVDICAPGYTVHSLWYDPNSTNVHGYVRNRAGSSLAAPLVSGTLGLMLSAKECLSPYQREYILKKSADTTLYSIPDNAPFANPKRLLGTGRLDADAAVRMAAGFNCNDPATKTMYIEDVKITHKCAVWTANGTRAQLSVVVKNGNGNYSYRWKRISNNTCVLDDEYSATPKVMSSYGTNGKHIFYYLLTVTEKGKEIPQVANKRVQINMTEDATWDLALRDAYMDMYNEPNNMDTVDSRDWNFWLSPDLWNRQARSSPIVTTHENPEYFITDSNYLHVRVKNVGCSYYPGSSAMTNPSELKVYWTKASTGEKWAADWTTANITGSNGNPVPAGREIPTSAPLVVTSQLLPGQEQMFVIPWRPPNPAEYDSSINQVEVCVLARLLDKSKTNDGLIETFGNVFPNVRNNNNIVTRNLIVTNFNPLNKLTDTRQIDVINAGSAFNTFRLQLINDKNINKHYAGDLSEYIHAVVHLGALYDIWVAGGSLGTAVDVDPINKTATFDFSTPLNFDNLSIPPGTRYPVNIELNLNSGANIPFDVTDGLIHFRQIEMNGEEEKALQGNVSIAINIDKGPSGGKQEQAREPIEAIGSTANLVKAYPNPARDVVAFEYNIPEDNKHLVLTITNITGQIVKQIKLPQSSGIYKWQTGQNLSGVYIYELSNNGKRIDIGRIVIAK